MVIFFWYFLNVFAAPFPHSPIGPVFNSLEVFVSCSRRVSCWTGWLFANLPLSGLSRPPDWPCPASQANIMADELFLVTDVISGQAQSLNGRGCKIFLSQGPKPDAEEPDGMLVRWAVFALCNWLQNFWLCYSLYSLVCRWRSLTLAIANPAESS